MIPIIIVKCFVISIILGITTIVIGSGMIVIVIVIVIVIKMIIEMVIEMFLIVIGEPIILIVVIVAEHGQIYPILHLTDLILRLFTVRVRVSRPQHGGEHHRLHKHRRQGHGLALLFLFGIFRRTVFLSFFSGW